jgi:hypothetical protein
VTVRSAAYLKTRFETGDKPTAEDFGDLIDSFFHAQGDNWPDPLPASSAENLTDIPIPDPLPAVSGANLRDVATQEYIPCSATPSYVDTTSFLLLGDWTAEFLPTRRLRFSLNPTGYYYAEVFSASYASGTGLTTVVINGTLPSSSLAVVAYGTIRPTIDGGCVSFSLLGRRAPIEKTGTYETTLADDGVLIECAGTFTVTLGLAADVGAGYGLTIKNVSTGTVAAAVQGSDTLDGGASAVSLAQNDSITVRVNADATGYLIVDRAYASGSGNADKVDGFDAAGTATAGALLALNGSAKLPASITGDADTVDGIHAAAVATANQLCALNGSAKLPASITGDADTVDTFHAAQANTVSTAAVRDAGGNIFCNAVRQELATVETSFSYVMVQKALGAGADNALRPADANWGRSQIRTATTSVSGTVTSIATFALNAYSFFPCISTSAAGAAVWSLAVPMSDPDQPVFSLVNNGTTFSYYLAWRYINP